jgi:hypothetical protein
MARKTNSQAKPGRRRNPEQAVRQGIPAAETRSRYETVQRCPAGKTCRQAEVVVTEMSPERRTPGPRESAEDRAWLERARANKRTSGITIEEYRRRRGL